jgi:hypothetical protein
MLTSLVVSVAVAGAALAGDQPVPSGMVVLDSSANGALSMVGNSTVQIPARAVYVNSSSTKAVSTTGSAVLDAPYLYVVGGASFNGSSKCTGQVINSVAPYVDPYAGRQFPDTSGMADLGGRHITTSVTLQPGYYSGGIRISGNAAVTLQPGLYVVGGDGLRLSSGSISGEGVCIAIYSGSLDIAGSSGMTLTPPADGPFAGITIAQPSFNTEEMKLAGGSEVDISGAIYAPRAMLTMVGNSTVEGTGPQMGDVVVAGRVTMKGTSIIRIGEPGAPPLKLPTAATYD